MKAFLENRRERIYDWMAREGIALVMFEDAEGRRDSAVRWLTGHPSDALLFLAASRQAVLVPWDINMARVYGDADIIVPYGEFDRKPANALRLTGEYLKIPFGARVEIPLNTSYTAFLKYIEAISDYDLLCRNEGVHETVQDMRAIKDAEEIRLYRIVSAFTNEIIDLLEEQIRGEKLKTETDVALFIEAESRKRDCEGMGFETIAAGPGRSFGIHAFPSYTNETFAVRGLSVLDFGLKYQGYTTDVSLTFVRPPLSKSQERLIGLIEKAYKLALAMIDDGAGIRDIALAVDAFFGKSKRRMPHALGHGIGLEPHEAPFLRNRSDASLHLQPGMIFTLEPGLYDPLHGGCRLENDILITDTGKEVLTEARIIRL